MVAAELLVLPGALEPAAAPPLGALLVEPLVDPLALVEPPAASFFSLSASAVAEELALLDGALDGALGAVLTEPEAEPEGALGVVVEPAEEEDEPAGGVVRETARSPSLSQPVSNPAPSARDTATAKVESLIMWGLHGWGRMITARFGPANAHTSSHHRGRQLSAARMAD